MTTDPQLNDHADTGEKFLHWMFLIIASVVMLLSFLMNSDGHTQVSLPGFKAALPGMCSTRMLFGISCPGCGLTRSFIAISNGNFVRAWQMNPASFLVYLFIAIQIPWQLFQLWRIRNRRPTIDSMWTFAPLIVAATALLLQWIVKLSMGQWVT